MSELEPDEHYVPHVADMERYSRDVFRRNRGSWTTLDHPLPRRVQNALRDELLARAAAAKPVRVRSAEKQKPAAATSSDRLRKEVASLEAKLRAKGVLL